MTDTFPHGGNLRLYARKTGLAADRIIDFSASINPLGPPYYLRKIISRSLEGIVQYPDPHGSELTAVLADAIGLRENQLLAANGSTEIIYAIPRAFNCIRGVIPMPAYLDYERACRLAGLEVFPWELSAENGFNIDFTALGEIVQEGDLVFLGRPNNPTGVSFPAAAIVDLAGDHPHSLFVVDESFFAFVSERSELIRPEMPANLIVIRSLTKFYAIPGLRLGFAAAAPQTISTLGEHIPPWTVNTLAQEVGKKIIGDDEYAEQSRSYVLEQREKLLAMLAEIPFLTVFPGEANYLLLQINKPGLSAAALADGLLSSVPQPIAIRNCANFTGLDDRYCRIAVRSQKENELLCEALGRELGRVPSMITGAKKKTPALMLQGTSSNAGKSVLAAAFCRILLQDGFRVAPFKAQNMSLNSFVTRDGGEMGRAQVVQAQACRLDPDVRMNPVLIKPSSDVGSQIIVNGRVMGNMSVDRYIQYKKQARTAALAAYDSLSDEYDVIVLEGAGSPAEVNLMRHDIVNMAMARYAEAPVLLVGDIDRGGVFASFIGTLEVMTEPERRLVAGYLVNRFRGQESLLADAYTYVEEFTGKPTLGTIPYLRDHGLPEEDSVSFKAGWYARERPAEQHVTIALIDLPHISNFTDFEPFLAEPDVHLEIIRTPDQLDALKNELAAIILPGSKNVITDLHYLEVTGLAGQIQSLAERDDIQVVGICGGFQMLGRTIGDPLGIESDGRELTGLGLLPLTTSLAAEKTLTRQQGTHLSSGCRVHGYEIHHGQSVSECRTIIQAEDGRQEGFCSEDGRIWGTYLHGIFDEDNFRRWFVDSLRRAKGMPPLDRVITVYDLEPAFDRLAAVVRKSVDMDRIYRIMGLQ